MPLFPPLGRRQAAVPRNQGSRQARAVSAVRSRKRRVVTGNIATIAITLDTRDLQNPDARCQIYRRRRATQHLWQGLEGFGHSRAEEAAIGAQGIIHANL